MAKEEIWLEQNGQRVATVGRYWAEPPEAPNKPYLLELADMTPVRPDGGEDGMRICEGIFHLYAKRGAREILYADCRWTDRANLRLEASRRHELR